MSLFRSCGSVVLSQENGNLSVSDTYAHYASTSAEAVAAEIFCVDQFTDSHYDAAVVQDPVDSSSQSCYGYPAHARVFEECDPFSEERFWHVLGSSMELKQGIGLAAASIIILCAGGGVGYAIVIMRRRSQWMTERYIQESSRAADVGEDNNNADADVDETSRLLDGAA